METKMFYISKKVHLLFFIILLFHFAAVATEDEGQKLARKVYSRPDGETSARYVSMTIKRKGAIDRVREFLVYSAEPKIGELFTLIKFIKPNDVKNTTLLTKDFIGSKNIQSIFLPALSRSRRISSSRMGGEFVGSHFTYEDLRDREVSEDNHRIIRKSKYRGKRVQILESLPIDPKTSNYQKRRLWIHEKTMVPLKVEFFDKKGKKVKKLEVLSMKKVGEFWTVFKSTMTDLEKNEVTVLNLNKIQYNVPIPANYFSKRTLENPSMIKSF